MRVVKKTFPQMMLSPPLLVSPPNWSLPRPSLFIALCWAREYEVSQANWPCPPRGPSHWTRGILALGLYILFSPRKPLPSFSKAMKNSKKSELFSLCENRDSFLKSHIYNLANTLTLSAL